MGVNQRRRPSREHDEDHHQGAKKVRRTTMLLMECTTEDVARFNEDMARSDKLLDDFEDRMGSFRAATDHEPVVPFISPCLLMKQEEDEE